MDDLISRQAAIDYCYALINAENPSDPSDEWNYSQERINQTEVILHHLEFMPSAQQWIPCSERLPEEDGTYFVSGVWENGDVEVGQLQYIADEHRFSNVIYFNVVAWMHLPSPYKEEE